MKFGLGQFTLQIPPWDSRTHAELYDDLLRIAVLAEELGFDSIWFAEHHGASDGYIPSLLPLLAAIAARTERLQLGTAVMLAPFHDPVRLAEDAAVVDLLSKGRLQLGLGLGWAPHEYAMFGVDSKGRGKRLSEMVEFLRLAWTADRFDYDGAHINVRDVSVMPKPASPIPIWLGGNDDRALRRAALLADGHFPPSTAGPADGVVRAKRIMELRAELGVSGPYRYGMFLPLGLGADEDEAWKSIRDGLLHVRGTYALWFGGERDVSNARDFASSFEEPARASAVVGTPAQVVSALRPALDEIDALGFDDAFVSAILVTVGMPYDVAADRMRTYAREVVAPLRGV
jgi:probable F420-dependent oxidoreductase